MTRIELERHLGKYVEVILFYGTVIEGTLHKTGEKAFENNPNLLIPLNFYFCTDNNNEVVKNTVFRVSHIQKISCNEKLRMKNFEKILDLSQPRKPIKSDEQVIRYVQTYECPNYGKAFTGKYILNYCYYCGQKLDWSDTE